MKRERYSKWAKSILRAEQLGKVIQSSKDKQYFAASFVDTLLAEGMCGSVHQAAGLASIAMRKAARKGKEIGTLEHPQREILTNYSRKSIQEWHREWKASDRGEC